MKKCIKCGERYPATRTYFYANKGNLDGLRNDCKGCKSAATRARHRERYATHPEAERARARAVMAFRRATDPERVRAEKRRHYLSNPGKAFEAAARRRAKKLSATGTHGRADVRRQFQVQGGKCWWCEKPLTKFHADHRIPLAKGGTDDPSNIVISCPLCNLSKHVKMPWEFNGRLL